MFTGVKYIYIQLIKVPIIKCMRRSWNFREGGGWGGGGGDPGPTERKKALTFFFFQVIKLFYRGGFTFIFQDSRGPIFSGGGGGQIAYFYRNL